MEGDSYDEPGDDLSTSYNYSISNDTDASLNVIIQWQAYDFDGNEIHTASTSVTVDANDMVMGVTSDSVLVGDPPSYAYWLTATLNYGGTELDDGITEFGCSTGG